MKELKELENIIIERLEEIRNKENKTLNDKVEYKELQEKLGKVKDVQIYIKEVK